MDTYNQVYNYRIRYALIGPDVRKQLVYDQDLHVANRDVTRCLLLH